MGMRVPGSNASSAAMTSFHVFGSGTATAGFNPSSLNTPAGFGPRTTRIVSSSAAMIWSLVQRDFSTSSMNRVPTPVSRMVICNSPARSRAPKSNTAGCRSRGISRIEGTTRGWPPCRSMSCAICSDNRLSKPATRSPANPVGDVSAAILVPPRLTRL